MRKNIVLWLIVLVYHSANGQTPAETVSIIDELSVTRNGIPVMDIQTSLASYKGCLYFGYVDKDLQMCISKKDLNGNKTTTVVATNVLEDPHNGVSIGIDQEGYIHFTGNMHQDKMQYWRSDKAEDISSFKKLHGDMTIGGLNGPNGVSYGRFIQSRRGTLFYLSRQRLCTSSEGWVPGDMGGSLQVYNTDTRLWQQLGSLNYSFKGDKGQVINGGSDAAHATKVVFWDNSGAGVPPLNGYQGYKIWVVFDKNNRMHMVWNVAKNPVHTTVSDTHTHLMYAYSDDEGISWKKSDGTALALPITTENGEVVYLEDPKVDATRMFNAVWCSLTSDNKPVIFQFSNTRNQVVVMKNIAPNIWKDETTTWNTGWPGQAYSDDNGWTTVINGGKWIRTSDNGGTFKEYLRSDASKGRGINSVDYPYLLETGKLRYVEELDATAEIRTIVFQNADAGQVMQPEIYPASGSRALGDTTVTISCQVPGAAIRYTTDGSEPTASSGTLYSAPFKISATSVLTKTIKAIAYKTGKVSSRLAAAQITIGTGTDNVSPTIPSGLSASAITSTGFQVKWTASTDNSGFAPVYEVYRGATLAGTTAGTSYTFSGLTPATTYDITVKAKDSNTPPNVSAASLVLKVTTSTNVAQITLSSSAPAIDGVKEALWQGEVYPIAINNAGAVNSPADLSGSFVTMFDNNYLYFFVDVTDNLLSTNLSNWFENDAVEFYIDGSNKKGSSYGPTDFQFYYVYNSNALKESHNVSTAGTEVLQKNKTGGYALEVKIPLSLLGISNLANNQKIGLDVMLIDNDGAWKGKLSWFNTLDTSWQYPYTFGTGVFVKSLVADTEPPTVPTGLVASAINSNSFILTWTPSTDNSGTSPQYEIYNGAVLAGTTQNTSYSLTGLTPATTYAVTVKAKDGATPPNFSAASQPLTVVTTVVSGIDDEPMDSQKKKIVLKPNPVLEGEDVEIQIDGFLGEDLVLGVYTFRGQIVFQTNLHSRDQYTLNGSILRTGTYLVKVKGKFSAVTGKLVVK